MVLYKKFIFRQYDGCWGIDLEFLINISVGELEVCYKNKRDGYTKSGIKLTEKEMESIGLMTSFELFRKYANNENLVKMDLIVNDVPEWEVMIVGKDGEVVEFNSGEQNSFEKPPVLEKLIEYIFSIIRTANL